MKATLPANDEPGLVSVETLRATVTEGPDAGATSAPDLESFSIGVAEGNDLVLKDETVSRFHVELRRTPAGVLVRDQGSRNGTWVGNVRVELAHVAAGTVLRLGKTHVRVGEGAPIQIPLFESDRLGALRGRSEAIRRVMAQLPRIARAEVPALITGESGTGKEVVARALHSLGVRADKPFVTLDCGALSPTLVASELFGHEKGSFTGAERRHVGAFERAHGGVLFLDEIGELPMDVQPMLLGALERRAFRRVGGTTDIDVDVRVVAATNRDLRAEVNAGRFRLDLYYRLAVVPLSLPSLRDRPEDVPLLAEHFLVEAGATEPLSAYFNEAQLRSLVEHSWPGNVRELRNVVEATIALGEAHLPERPLGGEHEGETSDPIAPLLDMPYKDARSALLFAFEQRYLSTWLERCKGNVSRVSRDARIDRSHLIDLIQRHNLK
jgi:DNA-binding NtrC family response regulator